MADHEKQQMSKGGKALFSILAIIGVLLLGMGLFKLLDGIVL